MLALGDMRLIQGVNTDGAGMVTGLGGGLGGGGGRGWLGGGGGRFGRAELAVELDHLGVDPDTLGMEGRQIHSFEGPYPGEGHIGLVLGKDTTSQVHLTYIHCGPLHFMDTVGIGEAEGDLSHTHGGVFGTLPGVFTEGFHETIGKSHERYHGIVVKGAGPVDMDKVLHHPHGPVGEPRLHIEIDQAHHGYPTFEANLRLGGHVGGHGPALIVNFHGGHLLAFFQDLFVDEFPGFDIAFHVGPDGHLIDVFGVGNLVVLVVVDQVDLVLGGENFHGIHQASVILGVVRNPHPLLEGLGAFLGEGAGTNLVEDFTVEGVTLAENGGEFDMVIEGEDFTPTGGLETECGGLGVTVVPDGGELVEIPDTHHLDSPKGEGVVTDGLGEGVEGIEEFIGQHTDLIDDEGFDPTPFFGDTAVFQDPLDDIGFGAFPEPDPRPGMDGFDGNRAASHTDTVGEEDGGTPGGGGDLVDFPLIVQVVHQVFDEVTFTRASGSTDEEVVAPDEPVVGVTLFLGEFFHGSIWYEYYGWVGTIRRNQFLDGQSVPPKNYARLDF